MFIVENQNVYGTIDGFSSQRGWADGIYVSPHPPPTDPHASAARDGFTQLIQFVDFRAVCTVYSRIRHRSEERLSSCNHHAALALGRGADVHIWYSIVHICPCTARNR